MIQAPESEEDQNEMNGEVDNQEPPVTSGD
jgi:hypothetical protein